MKYLEEFQDPEPGQAAARRHPRDGQAALGDDGGLRRADPLDHPARPRPAAARRHRADPRARVPGVRDPARGHRQGAGDRLPAGRHLLLVRRHAAGARAATKDLFRVKSAGGDVRVVYSPLDALNDRAGEPRPAGGVLRHRLRDHRAAQRDDRLPGQEARHRELQPAGQPRAGATGDRGDHDLAGLPGAGVPRRRARVHGDGHAASTPSCPSGSRCRSWSPASSRSTSSRASGARSTSSRRARRGRERLPARRRRRRQPGRDRRCSRTSSRSSTGPGAASG